MTNELKCIGCGVSLQSQDEALLGFIPASSLDKPDPLCKRCFNLRYHNKNTTVPLDDDDFLEMVSTINDTSGLVVHLIDIFDANGTFIHSLPRIVGNNPVILVGNKVDLLPKSTNKRKLEQWLYSLAKEVGLKVIGVYLISSKKGHQIDALAERMEKERKQQNIYVVGVTNVGKSTFINRFIANATGVKEAITTSYYPGTTLGFIEIPLDEKTSLIDTPGIINNQQIAHYVSKDDLKIITPKNEVKARNYQLNSGQTLFIGGLARFDFVKGERQTFVCYFANDIPIHRTKLENADDLYARQVGELLTPPNAETLKKLPALVKNSHRIEAGYTDIVFPGLGWIMVLDGDVTVNAHSPQGVSVTIRQSINNR